MAFGFEPKYTPKELEASRNKKLSDENETMEYRLANTLWCKCDNCVEMPTGKECYCYCQSAEISI
jgi:hypothetical protein